MNVQPSRGAHRHLLRYAIAFSLGTLPFASAGRDLIPGEKHTVLEGDPLETWRATKGAELTLAPGAATLLIDLTQSTLSATNASIMSSGVGASGIALQVANGSHAVIQGGNITSTFGTALSIAGVSGDGGDSPASATLTGTSVSGSGRGVGIGNGGSLLASGATIEARDKGGYGIVLASGSAHLVDGTYVSGAASGVLITGDPRGGSVGEVGRFLTVDGSTVEGLGGAAVAVTAAIAGSSAAAISVVNGGRLLGSNGVAIDIGEHMNTDVTIAGSTVEGDINAASTATGIVTLGSAGILHGGMTGGGISAGIDDGAMWTLSRTSSIGSLRLDGAVAFDTVGGPKHLDIAGDLTGLGGSLTLNTSMNSGGALDKQVTDRLLVHGSVGTTGTTLVSVLPTGDGALTDLNRNGAVDANEGISIIQVAGASRADAFALRGTYVAAGPYQYTLHAFGPGATDPAQNALGSDPLNWDYRLGNRYVSDCGDHCAPVDPTDPVNPVDPVPEPGPVDRAAVVPQLPSYLVAPVALQNYGNLLNDGLHQRLGEIRESTYGASVGGEVFARYVGSQLSYTRNLSFQRYGYDFDQQINALQIGGGIVSLDNDAGSLRGGWALDSGTTRVTPSAADGSSRAKYYANGGSAWVTWQHGASSLWIDGVLSATRYHGDVSTDLRGEDVGKLRAQGWTMSVETGLPLPLGGDWTVEPQFQVRVQRLSVSDFRDKDGLDIDLGTSTQITTRLGAQVARVANPVFSPYGRFDLLHTVGGNPALMASSEAWNAGDRFQTGRAGNSVRVAAGLTSQLTDHVQLYGEGNWQQRVGGYGLRGWAANAGVRVTF
jgi:outer membrane autotransporter barrel domain